MEFPLHSAAPEHCARIRSLLAEARFDETTLCRELRVRDLASLGSVPWKEIDVQRFPLPFHRLIQLFLYGEKFPRAELENLFGKPGVEAFVATGLLRALRQDPTVMVSPVFFYPVGGLLIASDRHDDPDGLPYVPPADVVFPAIFAGTLRFLRLLPERVAGEALDLCGGSGVGALHLARGATRTVSADITPRATRYAEFNAQLNDLRNVEAVCGDLYAPVCGRRFCVITAHPPYVPSLSDVMIYRDGGLAGEDITRRIIEGLPNHLEAGGACYVLALGYDAEGQTFETRARSWLGEPQAEFDVLFGLEDTRTPEQVVLDIARRVKNRPELDPAGLYEVFKKLGARQFVYGTLVVRRHAGATAECVTRRIGLSSSATSADLDRWLAWQHHRAEPDFTDWMGQARPRLSPGVELNVRYVVREAGLVPAEFVFETDRPFRVALRVDGWVVPLISRFDGTRSVAEVLGAAQAAGEVPPGFELKDFGSLIAMLVERDHLQVGGRG